MIPKGTHKEKAHIYIETQVLKNIIDRNYFSLKQMSAIELLANAHTILSTSIELIEKSLKFYLSVETDDDNYKIIKTHNIHRLFNECELLNDNFKKEEFKTFFDEFEGDDGYVFQSFRYGRADRLAKVELNIENFVQMAEKIYFETMFNLSDTLNVENNLKLSFIYFVYFKPEFTQLNNLELARQCIEWKNPYMERFLEIGNKIFVKEKLFNEQMKEYNLKKDKTT